MKTLLFILACAFVNVTGLTQGFRKVDSATFIPQNKKILLLKNDADKSLILFRTNLAVNTDGIPISYHPNDLRGNSIALNSILNAVFVFRNSDGVNLSVPRPKSKYSQAERNRMAAEAYSVIEQWRDSKYEMTPPGYRISWNNVLVSSHGKPCIFSDSSKYPGYFASATALTNHLTTNMGECNCNDQVDPFVIPALVLAKNGSTKNPVRTYGAAVGDLVLAYNPLNKQLVYAIIGDTGPEDNLGEGSVILNMKLKGVTQFPANKRQTYGLATDKNIMICIVPGSKTFEIERPYSQANIQNRITDWFRSQGYGTETEIKKFFEDSMDELE